MGGPARATSAPPSPTTRSPSATIFTGSGTDLGTFPDVLDADLQTSSLSADGASQRFNDKPVIATGSIGADLSLGHRGLNETPDSDEGAAASASNAATTTISEGSPLSERRNSVKIGHHEIPIVSSDSFMSARMENTDSSFSSQRQPQTHTRPVRRRNNGVHPRTNRNLAGSYQTLSGPHALRHSMHPHHNTLAPQTYPSSYANSYSLPMNNPAMYHPPSGMHHPPPQQFRNFQYGLNQPHDGGRPSAMNLSYPNFNLARASIGGPVPPMYHPGFGAASSSFVASPPHLQPNVGTAGFQPCGPSDYQQPGGNYQMSNLGLDHGMVFDPSRGTRYRADGISGSAPPNRTLAVANPISPPHTPSMSQVNGSASIPRGPPRKPRQTGHAIWVGNLPPDTKILGLKDHFSRGATNDIESLFLITKSNCAFVNYRTHASCSAAIARFHDSRFEGARLVCRMRKSMLVPSVEKGSTELEVDQAGSQHSVPTDRDLGSRPATNGIVRPISDSTTDHSRCPDRYFIIKSLTRQDIEQSIRSGIWATQQHNEAIFNRAFETTDNVYLIFSANKTGEYFGYARMSSPIIDDNRNLLASSTSSATNEQSSQDVGPKNILTPATEWAPPGVIVDDSSRGTIFWEACHSSEESDQASAPEHSAESITSALKALEVDVSCRIDSTTETDPIPSTEVQGSSQLGSNNQTAEASPRMQTSGEGEPRVSGKLFQIEWKSTMKVSFTHTRGLHNPWNFNKEVKIARDGTELETQLGRRLVSLFHPPYAGPSGEGYGPASVHGQPSQHPMPYSFAGQSFEMYPQGYQMPMPPNRPRFYMPYHY